MSRGILIVALTIVALVVPREGGIELTGSG